jgi:hypothetical protein
MRRRSVALVTSNDRSTSGRFTATSGFETLKHGSEKFQKSAQHIDIRSDPVVKGADQRRLKCIKRVEQSECAKTVNFAANCRRGMYSTVDRPFKPNDVHRTIGFERNDLEIGEDGERFGKDEVTVMADFLD